MHEHAGGADEEGVVARDGERVDLGGAPHVLS